MTHMGGNILRWHEGESRYPMFEIFAGKDALECETILNKTYIWHPESHSTNILYEKIISPHEAHWMVCNFPTRKEIFCTICGRHMEPDEAKRIIEVAA